MRFNKEKFLLTMLASIFVVEGIFIAAAVTKCFSLNKEDYTEMCPQLADRTEKLFGVAVATTLSLLGASAMSRNNEDK